MNDERTETQTPGATRPSILVYWQDHVSTHPLPARGEIVVGRGDDCEIRVDHPSVSRRHMAIRVAEGVFVVDLASSNGTRLGGRRLSPNKPEVVPPGVLIEVGLATVIIGGSAGLDLAAGPAPKHGDPAEPTMSRLERLIDVVSASRISVLLLGETGVGKEVLAQRIHSGSPRASCAFVRINCAAMPEALLEAELFGYERGAFTGAVQSKPGLVEAAHGGSLFLDEVGDMPLATQAKLLRVLESREVQRVGALEPRVIDVRFIAATNADLEARMREGTFRSDLYYRLNGITLAIPPLRDRRGEIPELVRGFIADACEAMGQAPSAISSRAMQSLETRDWPGNIRELRNAIERAVVLSRGATIDVEHVAFAQAAPRSTKAPPSAGNLRADVEAVERARLVDALDRSAGNQTEAAKLLGISRRMLVGRLDLYGLPRPRKKP
jgi:two-component system response regulator AtoC